MIRFSKFIAAAVLVASSAGIAGAQAGGSLTRPVTFGISGGASVPTGDMSNAASTGYNVNGHIGLGFAPSPISLRGDVGYNNWSLKGTGNSSDYHTLDLMANAVLSMPASTMMAHPYLIGGIGAFKPGSSYSTNGSTVTSNSNNWSFGFNVGGGLALPLSGLNAFVEAKYTQVNENGYTDKFVPITFGIMF